MALSSVCLSSLSSLSRAATQKKEDGDRSTKSRLKSDQENVQPQGLKVKKGQQFCPVRYLVGATGPSARMIAVVGNILSWMTAQGHVVDSFCRSSLI